MPDRAPSVDPDASISEPDLDIQLTFGGSDEDGSLLAADDDRYYFAWISNRNGNVDVFIKDSDDGLSWGEPWVALELDPQLYGGVADDYIQYLTQDADGAFRLTGGRPDPNGDFQIYTVTSLDIRAWGTPKKLTSSPGTKFAFNGIEQADDGQLYLVYSWLNDGRHDIYMEVLGSGQPPRKVIESPRQDVFPFFRIANDGRFFIAWLEIDSDKPYEVLVLQPDLDHYLSNKTDVMLSMSFDKGVSWSLPTRYGTDNFVNNQGPAIDTIPALLDGPQGLYLAWLTPGLGIGEPDVCGFPQVHVVLLPLEGPGALDPNHMRYIPNAGYSIRSMPLADGRWALAYVRQEEASFCGEPNRPFDDHYRVVADFDFPLVFP